MKKVVIVGAGLGGLSAGIKLAASGFSVTIVDKNNHTGGKMMPVQLGEYSFDFGPNTITMPNVFKRVFEEVGENPDHYLQFEQITDHTKNWYMDGTSFLQTTNIEKMQSILNSIDRYSFRNYHHYLSETKHLYHMSEKHFFSRTFSSVRDYLSPSLATALMRVRPLESMDHFHRRFFKDERVLMAFNRYATYIGSSPYSCPATFSLIGYLEMVNGVYYTKGGNTLIASRFTALYKKVGGNLLLDKEVTSLIIDHKLARGVVLAGGEKLEADIVILNGDLLTSYSRLLAETDRPHMNNRKIASFEPSISAFVIMAGVNKTFKELVHHQVYFTSDYRKEFEQIFRDKKLPDDPTIYICNSSATDPNRTKGSNLFILVNAPANPNLSHQEIVEYKEKIYSKLKQFGLDISPYLEEEMVVTPNYMKTQFNAYNGALYGISSHRKKDAFLRPFNRDPAIKNLFFTGGTTHPGGGSPMVTISGMNTAELILKNHF